MRFFMAPRMDAGRWNASIRSSGTTSTYMLEENMTFMADMFLHRGGMGFRWEKLRAHRKERRSGGTAFQSRA